MAAWLALTTHVPAVMMVTTFAGGVVAVFVVTEHTVGLVVVNITELPLAPGVALTVKFGVVLVAPPTPVPV